MLWGCASDRADSPDCVAPECSICDSLHLAGSAGTARAPNDTVRAVGQSVFAAYARGESDRYPKYAECQACSIELPAHQLVLSSSSSSRTPTRTVASL